jgi:hypothetical protein
MTLLKREIDQVIEQSAQRLLKVAVPPVKFWTLVYVMRKGPEDRNVQKAFEETKSYGPKLKLLASLREDGTWPISRQKKAHEDAGPGPPYGWTHITMLRNLYNLSEYCAGPDEGHIQASFEKILSWQDEDGFIRGPMEDMIHRPYYCGLTLSIMRGFGMKANEPSLRRMADWLYKIQRGDGGWNIPYIQDMKYRPPYRSMRLGEFKKLVREGKTIDYNPEDYGDIPSCYWTTVGALRGLSWLPDHERYNDARRGGSYILNGFFKKNYHPGFYKSEKNWKILKFPTFYGSGLTALDVLIGLGFGHDEPKMEAPFRWLLEARAKDGFWYHTERPHALNDQWLTMVALSLLALYSESSMITAMMEMEDISHELRSQQSPR